VYHIKVNDMAKVKGIFDISGSLGNVSVYTRRGSDTPIMRAKGGASKSLIQKSARFAKLRLHQNEWRGCVIFSQQLNRSFSSFKPMSDHNVAAAMNGLAKRLQKNDTTNAIGERHVNFSAHKGLLLGYAFNRKELFENIVRVSVEVSTDRAGMAATVKIPAIEPSVHLVNRRSYPLYRFVVVVAVLHDMAYNAEAKSYFPKQPDMRPKAKGNCSAWFGAKAAVEAQTIAVAFNASTEPLTDRQTMVVGVGVEFGTFDAFGQPEAVPYSGSARIAAVD
jgi:hypothetical protein